MPHDEELAERVRACLARRRGVSEKRMFGGLAFLAGGHMFAGVLPRRDLMVRVGPKTYEAALREPHVRRMDLTGRALTGFVFVGAPALKTDAALRAWLGRGLAFVRSLRPKEAKRK
jgi:TfoX/Sxy family transcriptional regulator of competence genes